LELFTPGDLERECYEEICNYEEAREIFMDQDKMVIWWIMLIGWKPTQLYFRKWHLQSLYRFSSLNNITIVYLLSLSTYLKMLITLFSLGFILN
jgi:hypothetical protein